MHNAVIAIPQHSNGRLYKTSICRHYELGNCSIGAKCQFAHGQKELRSPNDPLPISMPTIEANLVITNYKTVLCKYDQQGFCKNGASCPYAHGASEKKQTRIAPSCLKKATDNKENGEEDSVDKFLNSLMDKLLLSEAFKEDKTLLAQLKSAQQLLVEKQHRDAAEQLTLMMSSPSRTAKQQTVIKMNQFIFTVNVYQNCICILKQNSELIIDRASARVVATGVKDKLLGSKDVCYFLGILRLKGVAFVVLVDNRDKVAVIEKQRIYRVRSVSFIKIQRDQYLTNEVQQMLHNIKELLTRYGFYYSLNGDIRATRQYIDEQCVWNESMMDGISNDFYCPLIQGYVEQISANDITVTMISRRSRYMGGRYSQSYRGTRYHSRGINDEGHVANYVETEQIVQVDNKIYSFILVRGSVPIFWTQDGTLAVKLTRSPPLTQQAYGQHFKVLQQKFNRILCVNLMQKEKQMEQKLTEGFEQQFTMHNIPNVKYEFFDFHSMTREQINAKIHQYRDIIRAFGWKSDTTLQQGTFRLNCLDCLDRTNVYMSKIAFVIFCMQLKSKQLCQHEDYLDLYDETNKKLMLEIILKFKHMWANHGDMISQIYAGTDSTISQIIRDGKQSFMGVLMSNYRTIERFYQSNFEDQTKQMSINAILNASHQDTDPNRNLYCNTSRLTMLVVTWNVSGKDPIQKSFPDLINTEGLEMPDLFVFGFQEIVDLNAQNIVITNTQRINNLWDQILQQTLDQQLQGYQKVQSANLVGIYITIFIRKQFLPRITCIQTDIVKTGLGGTLGNKGACIISMKIDDTKLVFANCHLTSGNSQVQERLKDIEEIHQKISTFDFCVFFGDMNFRLDASYQDVINQIQSQTAIQDLFVLDQLQKVKGSHRILKNYQEGGINFLPTYKYGILFNELDFQSNRYDTSKKKRVPSWCDRILINSSDDTSIISQLFYSRREYLESDHRPVTSYYAIEIRKIDKHLYQKVQEEFKQMNIQNEVELL